MITIAKTPHGNREGLLLSLVDLVAVCRVGAPGFEPGTSCSQSRRDTGLRYAPKYLQEVNHYLSEKRRDRKPEAYFQLAPTAASPASCEL